MALTRKLRSIPPSLFIDERLMELPLPVRWTAIALRFYVDDQGRASASVPLIRAALWPFEPEVTDAQIEEHLYLLDEVNYLQLYVEDGRTFIVMTEHPSQDRAAASELPDPPRNRRETLATSSRRSRDILAVEGREGSGDGDRGAGARERVRFIADAEEPSPLCAVHQRTGVSQYPCGPCASARSLHGIWMRKQLQHIDDEQQ